MAFDFTDFAFIKINIHIKNALNQTYTYYNLYVMRDYVFHSLLIIKETRKITQASEFFL